MTLQPHCIALILLLIFLTGCGEDTKFRADSSIRRSGEQENVIEEPETSETPELEKELKLPNKVKGLQTSNHAFLQPIIAKPSASHHMPFLWLHQSSGDAISLGLLLQEEESVHE